MPMIPRDSFFAALNRCLSRDCHRLLQHWRRLNKQANASEADWHALQQRLDLSQALYQKRLASKPALDYPDLPVAGKRLDIIETIKSHQVTIVCGETGSGKTTQLPKICLEAGRGAAGLIGHTQPRRIAARTVAARIAEELNEPLGQSVGYKVRFHDQTRPQALVKLMTDGLLLAESQGDRFLSDYDTLIIDEAHERSLNIDFLLGYLKWLLPKRPDLKLVITSATIDPERFARHFDDAPIIMVSGRTYPVEMRYRPIVQDEEEDETSSDLQNAITDAVDELAAALKGSILIFMSGEQEIKETTETLRKHHPKGYDILPLYAKLSAAEQKRVFEPSGKPRIVLATNVAETSLTVPGIVGVIDPGHARINRYSHRSKIQRLPIERISQASARQRAGRCGRIAPGICIRLYSEDDFNARPAFTEPEIQRSNLSSVMLQMASLKLGAIEDFPFVDPPDDKMIRDGKTMLHEVNALDKQGRLTDTGKQLARIPADPKLARMLLAAADWGCVNEVSIIVAALSIQDPRDKPAEKMAQAEAKHARFQHPESDFLSLINLWNDYQEKKKQLSNNKLRKYCQQNFLSYVRMKEWYDIHGQILAVVKGELKLAVNSTPAGFDAVHRSLLPGLLSNIGFRHETYEYLGARGLKFFIFPGSGLMKLKPKWIMAAEQVETSKVYARTVARIEPEWIEYCAQHLIKRNHFDPHWEAKKGRSAIYERTLLYGLTLTAKRKIPYEHVDPDAARTFFIRFGLVDGQYTSKAPFFKTNQALIEELEQRQHKSRRFDFAVDEDKLFAFYDRKIPAEVTNGVRFETWRKQAERRDAKLLFLTEQDLAAGDEAYVSDFEFPKTLTSGRLTLPLHYRFEPGHSEDGVSVQVPLHQLNQLDEKRLDWLVPGLWQEKVTLLLKGLPKQLRKAFVPIPDMARQCLEVEPEPKGVFLDWLTKRLRQLTGESVPLTEWRPEILPDHLRFNIQVLDDHGKILIQGRNLDALRGKFQATASSRFEQLAETGLNKTGLNRWDFGEVPEVMEFSAEGQTVLGYPALSDAGDSVSLSLYPERAMADFQHRQGVAKLLIFNARQQAKFLQKNLIKAPGSVLWHDRLQALPLKPARPSFGLIEDALLSVFGEGCQVTEAVRDLQAFNQVWEQGRGQLASLAQDLRELIDAIYQSVRRIEALLESWPKSQALRQDVEQQLAKLLFKGFVRSTPQAVLKHYPRYLQAVELRLEKRQLDDHKLRISRRLETHYWQAVAERSQKETFLPETDPYRWLLEELRVSFYAQQLKTPYPVSEKRLEKAWQQWR
ncbi:MAG: ATP-dependent RNA helicase HrpA [Methylococcales bacterium]|nr:ATP-dependent RNA helicase HrpA [Methylococcales bacterium]